jgi:hypothetical protein
MMKFAHIRETLTGAAFDIPNPRRMFPGEA